MLNYETSFSLTEFGPLIRWKAIFDLLLGNSTVEKPYAIFIVVSLICPIKDPEDLWNIFYDLVIFKIIKDILEWLFVSGYSPIGMYFTHSLPHHQIDNGTNHDD